MNSKWDLGSLEHVSLPSETLRSQDELFAEERTEQDLKRCTVDKALN